MIAMVVSVMATTCSYEDGNNPPGSGGSSGRGAQGGTQGAGGSTSGGTSAGGSAAGGVGAAGGAGGTSAAGGAGGAGTGGSSAGAGGAGTGGSSAGTDGAGTGGSSAGTGGAGTGGAGTGGGGTAGSSGSAGTGGAGGNPMGPCDIYAAASPATPCVAAYSTVRVLRSAYTGPLYQVRKGGPDPNTGSGGMTQDIGSVAGFADAAAQNTFCGTSICTVSILYDQSGRGNNLTVAKRGCYMGTASEDDYESDAKRRPLKVSGRDVYALYMDKHDGYRSGGGVAYPNRSMPGAGMPRGEEPQGIYMVAEGSGRRPGTGCCCCWNFGNASTNNCYGPSGQMNALFLGTGYWGKGSGNGPWFLGDFEAGVWAGGTGPSNAENLNLPSMTMNYAFGILKTRAGNYAIRTANAQTGALTTAYDGGVPTAFPGGRWSMEGGIVLGIGGDNSNSSDGTFLEGAITAGRPTDATDAAVLQNVQAARYGM
jgi:non-reducing end alpha-L-arabinofuranosidase